METYSADFICRNVNIDTKVSLRGEVGDYDLIVPDSWAIKAACAAKGSSLSPKMAFMTVCLSFGLKPLDSLSHWVRNSIYC